MTISSTTRIAGPFTGNGTASTFPFTFKVFAAADLDVVRLNSSTGVESTLVLNSDYSVTLNGDQNSNPGGSITLLAGALATGFTLVITSDIANLQPTDLTNQGGFYPEVITDALDRATIQIQQISDIGDRTLKIPISDGTSINMELPTASQRANSFLTFDANGEPTVVTSGSSGAPATITRQVFSGTGSQTVFTLASDPGALGNSAQVYIGGVYQQRSTYTILGTTLTFSAAPVAGTDNIEFVNFLTDNVGSVSADLVAYTPAGANAVARSAKSKMDDVVSVKDFGAAGDGVIDDTAAFNNAVTAAGTRNVFVPGGSYKITGTVTGSFYSDATVTIVSGTVNTINRIGSVLSTTGALTVTGTAATGALTVTGTASVSDNVIISTSGKGIDFSATASGSGTMTSELLNDYEEGTWTPVITFGGASVGMVYGDQFGRYTKVGRVVHVQCYVALTNKGTSTGTALVDGLPFAAVIGSSYSPISARPANITFADQFLAYVDAGLTSVTLQECTNAGNLSAITNADFSNASNVILSGSYIVA
jgi:hypothetical protein